MNSAQDIIACTLQKLRPLTHTIHESAGSGWQKAQRALAKQVGWAFYYPDIEAYFESQGLTLVLDSTWVGFEGERRAGIEQLPGHVLVFWPGRWYLKMGLARVPTEATQPGCGLTHTSDPLLLSKTGLGWKWLWEGSTVRAAAVAMRAIHEPTIE